jgi:hypothetical protein
MLMMVGLNTGNGKSRPYQPIGSLKWGGESVESWPRLSILEVSLVCNVYNVHIRSFILAEIKVLRVRSRDQSGPAMGRFLWLSKISPL